MDAAALALVGQALESKSPLAIGLSIGYVLVFGWLLVGIRRDLHSISRSMASGFAAGEERFSNLENRVEVLERNNHNPSGG